jgi:2-oxo-4-hydroxy-4-carboxy-5-ureidoimidazoline decarboxylase
MVSPGPQASALAAFNAASPEDAERDMLACCASGSFARMIADGRPYPDPAALQQAVNSAFATLSWDDIAEGLDGHPRIGDRVRSGGWSAAEQSGAASAGDAVRQALADGNLAYEERFGHVFLICASGLSGQQMLDQLRARLGHDPEAERAVVREELLKITQLRLTKLLGSRPGSGTGTGPPR